jgi:phosphoenolpyruvate carboxylase
MLPDHLDLASALREHRRRARRAGEEPIAVDPATRDNLHLLHATRLAVLRAMMSRAVDIPDFSDRHAVTHDELVLRLFRLDVEATLGLLAEIFPIEEGGGESFDYGEPATYGEAGPTSYDREHALFLRPLARWYELVRRISTGIVHHLGAVG